MSARSGSAMSFRACHVLRSFVTTSNTTPSTQPLLNFLKIRYHPSTPTLPFFRRGFSMRKSLIYGLLPLLLACNKGDKEPTKEPTGQPKEQPKETQPNPKDISANNPKDNPGKGISKEAEA